MMRIREKRAEIESLFLQIEELAKMARFGKINASTANEEIMDAIVKIQRILNATTTS